MKRKVLIVLILITVAVIGTVIFLNYWVNTQPVWIVNEKFGERKISKTLPLRNRQIMEYLERNGQSLAPSYEETVCTGFVIKVIEHFVPLSATEEKQVQIITHEDIGALIAQDAPAVKGVVTALTSGKKGTLIERAEDVKPGDFVQFWNNYRGKQYGHCGVVLSIEPGKNISVYSSHPATDGFGKQTFLWPDHVYFARLR